MESKWHLLNNKTGKGDQYESVAGNKSAEQNL